MIAHINSSIVNILWVKKRKFILERFTWNRGVALIENKERRIKFATFEKKNCKRVYIIHEKIEIIWFHFQAQFGLNGNRQILL